jgi:CelD/BcsL family acetyltransferase involved in cellulose biosynthesis
LPRFLSEHIGQNDEPNPVLPLPITLAELETTLSTHCKRKLRYYWKRSERLGAMTVEQATPETWEKHLDALFRLHEMRWQQKGEGGVLPPNVQAAHRESVPALLEIGACALYSVLLNGEIVGVFYGLQDPALPRPNRTWGRRLYCYIGGWNPNYAEIAPASVLIGHALEQAVKNGLTHCDFLRGAESYKYVWGATDTHTMTRVLRKVQM